MSATNNSITSGKTSKHHNNFTRQLINNEGRFAKKQKLNNNFHKRAMRGQSHLLVENAIAGVKTVGDKILNPLDRKNPYASYIEVNPDELRKITTEYLDARKFRQQSWKLGHENQTKIPKSPEIM